MSVPQTPTSLDLEPIKSRIRMAQRIHGVSFDGYPDEERDPVDIQRDRDRSALVREVERLRSTVAPLRDALRAIVYEEDQWVPHARLSKQTIEQARAALALGEEP